MSPEAINAAQLLGDVRVPPLGALCVWSKDVELRRFRAGDVAVHSDGRCFKYKYSDETTVRVLSLWWWFQANMVAEVLELPGEAPPFEQWEAVDDEG